MSFNPGTRLQGILKAITKRKQKERNVGYSPADRITQIGRELLIPEGLSDEEVGAFLRELPESAKPIVLFVLESGLSRSEVHRLKWEDIDTVENLIRVRHATGSLLRIVPLSNTARAVLSQLWRRKGSPQRYSRTPGPGPASDMLTTKVFAGMDLPRPSSVNKILRNAGTKAGIGGVHLKLLRDTFAARLHRRGVPADRVKQLLGCKSVKILLVQSSPTELRGAIETLNGHRLS